MHFLFLTLVIDPAFIFGGLGGGDQNEYGEKKN